MRMFPLLIFTVALLIAGNAAYFSVKGIGLLFAGSFLSVIIMASSLEIGKLVTVSLLYRKWHDMRFAMKTYLSGALLLLMIITSLGIYGFLSDAYQDTKTKVELYESQIESLRAENTNTQSQIDTIQSTNNIKGTKNSETLKQYQKIYDDFADRMQVKRSQLNDRLKAMDEEVMAIQAEAGGLFSSKNKKLKELKEKQAEERASIQSQLTTIENELKDQYDVFLKKVDELNSQPAGDDNLEQVKPLYEDIRNREREILEIREYISDTDIGSFKFISQSLNIPTDDAVKWFIFIIVIVFDPLAVCLMIGYNMYVMRHPYEGYKNKPVEEQIDEPVKKTWVKKLLEKIGWADEPYRRQNYR
jgi:hypothetical protein